MRELTPAELGYAAGIVDGEGSFAAKTYQRIRADRDNPTVYTEVNVQVVNTDIRILNWFKERFGGSISTRVPKNPKHRVLYVWIMHGGGLVPFLKAIKPYLVSKAAQADICIILQGIKQQGTQTSAYREKQRAIEDLLVSKLKEEKHSLDPQPSTLTEEG